MKTTLSLALLLLVGPARPAASQAITPDRTIPLFNGTNLDHFYTWLVDTAREDPHRVFSVVDQVDGAPAIRISGQHWGGLITKRAYRDYHLVLEFRF